MTIHRGLHPSQRVPTEQTLPADRRNHQRRAETNTFRTSSHVFPCIFEASDQTKFQTRGGWPQGCNPSSKKLGSVPVFGQHLYGAPRYRCRRIYKCHFTGSAQKINLVVASWCRGEFPGGSRIFRMQLVVFQIDCGSMGFQVGPVQQQHPVFRNHMCHKANHLLTQIPSQFYCPLRVLSAVVKSLFLRWANVRMPTWLSVTDFRMGSRAPTLASISDSNSASSLNST